EAENTGAPRSWITSKPAPTRASMPSLRTVALARDRRIAERTTGRRMANRRHDGRPVATVRPAQNRGIIDHGGRALKAAAFAYAKPRALPELFDLLERHGERARVLAGGQSLIASLGMRLSSPELLVDIGALPLKAIVVKGQLLSIGALVTHAEIDRS